MLHRSLALALVGMFAASAMAALPGPFPNAGGPEFLDGPAYQWMEDTETIKTIGATWNNTYAFSEIVDGTMATEFGVYTSWECDAARPGFYRALLDMRLVAADGTLLENGTMCEYGTVDPNSAENRWAQNATACPTETDQVNFIFSGNDAERNITNTCGVPEIGPPADSAASLVSDLLDNIKADKPGNGTAAR